MHQMLQSLRDAMFNTGAHDLEPESIEKLIEAKPVPSLALQIIVQVEAEAPVEKLSDSDVAPAALQAGARSARIRGDLHTVSSWGRFEHDCYNSLRVGCFICQTGAMMKWC